MAISSRVKHFAYNKQYFLYDPDDEKILTVEIVDNIDSDKKSIIDIRNPHRSFTVRSDELFETRASLKVYFNL